MSATIYPAIKMGARLDRRLLNLPGPWNLFTPMLMLATMPVPIASANPAHTLTLIAVRIFGLSEGSGATERSRASAASALPIFLAPLLNAGARTLHGRANARRRRSL